MTDPIPPSILEQLQAGCALGALYYWNEAGRPSCEAVLNLLYAAYLGDRDRTWLFLALYHRQPADVRTADLALYSLCQEQGPTGVKAREHLQVIDSSLARWMTILVQGDDDEEMIQGLDEMEVLTPGAAILLGRALGEDRYQQVSGNLHPVERCYLYLGRGAGPVPAELDYHYTGMWNAAAEDADLLLLHLLWQVREVCQPEGYQDPICGTVTPEETLPTLVTTTLVRLSSYPEVWRSLWDLYRPDPGYRDSLILQPYYLSSFPPPVLPDSHGPGWIWCATGYATRHPPTWMTAADQYQGWSLYPYPGQECQPALTHLRDQIRVHGSVAEAK